jgi:hypothetical protein
MVEAAGVESADDIENAQFIDSVNAIGMIPKIAKSTVRSLTILSQNYQNSRSSTFRRPRLERKSILKYVVSIS